MAKDSVIVRLLLNNTDFVRKMNMSTKEVNQFKARTETAINGLKSAGSGFLGPLTGALGPLAALTAGLGGLSAVTASVVNNSRKMETALASLSALTGTAGKDLDTLRQSAIELSRGSGMAAADIVAAMEKVGSAMPELLKNQQGLLEVTEAAKLLAGASRMGMDESINNLTGIMNQFGAKSNEAKKYVNILAAASKEGAAAIPYLSKAIEKSAGSAISAGLSFADLVGVIEAIAPKFSNADEAGTALRGVLTRLETRTTDCKISQVGLNTALANFAKKSEQDKIKIVGEEALRMANSLAEASGEAERYATVIQGTNTASEQAAKNADTLDAASKRLGNAWDNLTLSFSSSTGVIKSVVNALAQATDGIARFLESYDTYLSRINSEASKSGSTRFEQDLEKFSGVKQLNLNAGGKRVQTVTNPNDAQVAKVLAESYKRNRERVQKELERYEATFDDFLGGRIGRPTEWQKDRAMERRAAYKKQAANTRVMNGPDINDLAARNSDSEWVKGRESLLRQLASWEAAEKAAREKAEALSTVKTAPAVTTPSSAKTKKNKKDTRVIAGGLDVTDLDKLSQKYKKLATDIAKLEEVRPFATGESLNKVNAALDSLRKEKKEADKVVREIVQGLDVTDISRELEGRAEKLTADLGRLKELQTYAPHDLGIRQTIADIEAELSKLRPEIVDGLNITAFTQAAKEAEKLEDELRRLTDLQPFFPDDTEIKSKIKEIRAELSKLRPEVVDGLNITAFTQAAEEADTLAANISRLRGLLEQGIGGGKVAEKYKELARTEAGMPLRPGELAETNDWARRRYELQRMKTRRDDYGEFYASETDPGKRENIGRRRDAYNKQYRAARTGYMTDAASTINGGLSSLGSLLSSLGLKDVGEKIGEVTSVISTVIGTIEAVSAVIELVSGAKVSAEIASQTANTAAIIANTAALVSLTSAVGVNTFASFLPFAEGGIVGGSSWTGDRLLARLNSGEMVLNVRQQKALLNGLNGVQSLPQQLQRAGSVTLRLRGTDIVGAINNTVAQQRLTVKTTR